MSHRTIAKKRGLKKIDKPSLSARQLKYRLTQTLNASKPGT